MCMMRGLATLLEGAGFVFKYLKIFECFFIFYGGKTAVKLDSNSENGYINTSRALYKLTRK